MLFGYYTCKIILTFKYVYLYIEVETGRDWEKAFWNVWCHWIPIMKILEPIKYEKTDARTG